MKDTYKIILDSYAKRLITTNSRTRTIYYGKNNKYIIDLGAFFKNVDEKEIKDFFCFDKGKTLKISYGAMSTSKAFELFDSFLEGKVSEEQFLDEYPQISDKDIALLKKEKKECYLELYNKYEWLKKKELKLISKINETNEAIIKQMGKDDLYIGYPYIQGRFNKDKVVRAPLLLHKVSVKEVGETVIFSNMGVKILNPVFIMSYLVENGITYTDSLDFEILEVACGIIALGKSSFKIPVPLSNTSITSLPPPITFTKISSALASIEFSTNSFTIDAGLSTTSPAAILLKTDLSKRLIIDILLTYFAF